MKFLAAAIAGVFIASLSLLAFQFFWHPTLECPPVRYLRLTSTYGNAATTWLELNGTDLDENPVLKSMFDAWNGNSSDPRVHGSSSAYEVTFGGTPADLQTVDDFLQSRGRAHGSVPIRYHGDLFLLSDGLIVC